MQIVGSKAKVAFVIGPSNGQIGMVQVWAASRNLTPVDTSPFLPTFIHGMKSDEALLRQKEKILGHEVDLRGLSVKKALERLISQVLPTAWLDLRVLEWGPTMDDVLCFLVPSQGKTHLAWMEFPSRNLHSLEIVPSEFAETLGRAREILESSGVPNA